MLGLGFRISRFRAALRRRVQQTSSLDPNLGTFVVRIGFGDLHNNEPYLYICLCCFKVLVATGWGLLSAPVEQAYLLGQAIGWRGLAFRGMQ